MDIGIWNTIAIVVLSILILVLVKLKRRRNVSQNNGLLIVGLSGSGKTRIYFKLTHQNVQNTLASLEVNHGRYFMEKHEGTRDRVNIIDIPGNEKFRYQYKDYVRSTFGIIFMVNLDQLSDELKGVCGFLFDLLYNEIMERKNISLLICAEKSDKEVYTVSVFKLLICNELLSLIRSREAGCDIGGVESVDCSIEGRDNEKHHERCLRIRRLIQDVKRKDCPGLKISFTQISLSDDGDMSRLETWIKHAYLLGK